MPLTSILSLITPLWRIYKIVNNGGSEEGKIASSNILPS